MRTLFALLVVAAAPLHVAAQTAGVQPITRVSRDSDGNTALRYGLLADIVVADSVRAGVDVARIDVRDAERGVGGWHSAVTAAFRPSRRLVVEAAAGALRIAASDVAAGYTEPTATARLRWRPGGGLVDMRARREPLAATPHLLAAPVTISEARTTVELPLAGPVLARGIGRAAALAHEHESNRRTAWGAGAVVRNGAGTEASALYVRTAYDRPSSAGYFAPARIEALDAGVYAEYYGAWPFWFALDAGGGVERITAHGEAAGDWQPAVRLWSQANWSLGDHAELRLELEAYQTQAAAVSAAAGAWRWGGIALALAWRP